MWGGMPVARDEHVDVAHNHQHVQPGVVQGLAGEACHRREVGLGQDNPEPLCGQAAHLGVPKLQLHGSHIAIAQQSHRSHVRNREGLK